MPAMDGRLIVRPWMAALRCGPEGREGSARAERPTGAKWMRPPTEWLRGPRSGERGGHGWPRGPPKGGPRARVGGHGAARRGESGVGAPRPRERQITKSAAGMRRPFRLSVALVGPPQGPGYGAEHNLFTSAPIPGVERRMLRVD